jgi:endoglucanase Acf2
LFYYDSNWGTLIGYPASYGSDEHLNDHHFHYGYWIRAAAEIARRDAAWAQPASWGTLVQLVIQDIANWDRTNPCFPYLRNFDVYEGHSWASGDGRFADGNNNESSSEGMNAWASLILWGEATGNRTIRDLGVYLYATEASSIEQYWFDVDGDNFMNAYQHNYASMIWGAKTVYETWFSADPQMVRGINMLPLTSTSLYLGYRPNTVSGNIAQLVTEFGSNKWTTWQDVLWGYQALADANGAVALYQANLGYAPEAGETRAHTYSMLYSLKALGQVDTSVTADTALYNVFKNGATITHVAYNAGSAPRQVRFSDGTVLTVPAGALASQ